MSTRFAQIGLLLLAWLAAELALPGDLAAQPFGVKRAPGRVDFVEKKRRMVLLPLLNMTGDTRLDYMREGIMKILADRFKNTGFLWSSRPETLLSVRPKPGAARRDNRPTRLALDVDAARLDIRVREVIALGDPYRRAELMESDYLLEGAIMSPREFSKLQRRARENKKTVPAPKNINGTAGGLVLEIAFFDARRGRKVERYYRLDRRRVYDGLDAVAEDLYGVFLGRPLVKFRVETPRPGAMAFIGDLYLGRTPLEYRLIPGRYRLDVRQRGYLPASRRMNLSSGGSKVFRVDNIPEERTAGLKILSDPPGARVYLDMEYIGTTPLDRGDLPGGAHRLRLSRKGYVDRFLGVELKPGQSKALDLKMRKGDTVAEYQDPHRVVLDWDYHELSFYSGLNLLGFYAGYIHFTIRADRIDDSVVALVPTLSILELDELGLYHFQIINQKAAEARVQRGYANGMAAGGAFSLVAAIFCLWRGIALDQREVGEIGFHLREEREAAGENFAATPAPRSDTTGTAISGDRAPTPAYEARYNVGVDFYF